MIFAFRQSESEILYHIIEATTLLVEHNHGFCIVPTVALLYL